MTATLLHSSKCHLGESPMWHKERNSCFWVDIDNCTLYEYQWLTKSVSTWKFQNKVTLAVQGKQDELILAFQGGIGRFNLNTGSIEWLLDLEKEKANHRCNDGACDRSGRLWVGTLEMNFQQGAGALYCIDKKLNIKKKIDGVTISNGITWSPDNKKLYYIDTPTQKVQCYQFDEEKAEIVFEKTAIEIPKESGSPDGMAIDEEGMLWIAHYGGSGVYRWNPENGKLMDQIMLPVPHITSCAFVGESLDHLLITTARENLSESQLEQYPESGSSFYIPMQVKGIAKNRCAL